MRIPIANRESATYIKLRRLGYSLSTIARALGRSTSAIYRRIRNALQRGIIRYLDLRKIPNQTRRLSRALQWKRIVAWLPRWESWILGEGEKPP